MKLIVVLAGLLAFSLGADLLFSNKDTVACVNDPAKKLCVHTNVANRYCCESNEFSPECGQDYRSIGSDQLENLGGNAKYMFAPLTNDCGEYWYYVNQNSIVHTETRTIPEDEVGVFRIRNDNWDSHVLEFGLGTQKNVDAYVYERLDDDELLFEAKGQLFLSNQNLQSGAEIEIRAYNFAYVVVTPNGQRDGVFGSKVRSIDDPIEPVDPDDPDHYYGFPLWAILGISFGSIFLIIFIGFIIIKFGKLGRSKPVREAQQNDAQYRMINEEILQNQAPQSYPQINTNQPQMSRHQPEPPQYRAQNLGNTYVGQQISPGNTSINQAHGHMHREQISPAHPENTEVPRYPAAPAKMM